MNDVDELAAARSAAEASRAVLAQVRRERDESRRRLAGEITAPAVTRPMCSPKTKAHRRARSKAAKRARQRARR